MHSSALEATETEQIHSAGKQRPIRGAISCGIQPLVMALTITWSKRAIPWEMFSGAQQTGRSTSFRSGTFQEFRISSAMQLTEPRTASQEGDYRLCVSLAGLTHSGRIRASPAV